MAHLRVHKYHLHIIINLHMCSRFWFMWFCHFGFSNCCVLSVPFTVKLQCWSWIISDKRTLQVRTYSYLFPAILQLRVLTLVLGILHPSLLASAEKWYCTPMMPKRGCKLESTLLIMVCRQLYGILLSYVATMPLSPQMTLHHYISHGLEKGCGSL